MKVEGRKMQKGEKARGLPHLLFKTKHQFWRACSCIALALVLAALALAPCAVAQRKRPKLLIADRDYFAGKIVLIPRNNHPDSVYQPRMIAQLADHEIITPPARMIGDPAAVTAWAEQLDYSNVKGMVISLDALGGRKALLDWIHKQHPGIPLHTFTAATNAATETSAAQDSSALQSITEANDQSTPEQPNHSQPNQTAAESELDAAAMMLVARLLNQEFGFAPKFLPLFSSTVGRAAVHRAVSEQIKVIGGQELASIDDAARSSGVLLFIHTPQTSNQERDVLIESLTKALEKGYRVAVLDLAESKEAKQKILTELRSLKMLDKLFSYASADLSSGFYQATARVLAHCSALTVGFRFLRTDLDRIHRIDRAHVALLISDYLSDFFYAIEIRPKVETFAREQLKADPANLSQCSGKDLALIEDYAISELRPVAEALFNEQFKNNIHAILINNGERAQFSIRLLQLLQFRLPAQTVAEAEIRPSVYLVYLGNVEK